MFSLFKYLFGTNTPSNDDIFDLKEVKIHNLNDINIDTSIKFEYDISGRQRIRKFLDNPNINMDNVFITREVKKRMDEPVYYQEYIHFNYVVPELLK